MTTSVSWTLNGHVICVLRRAVWMEIRAATALKTHIRTGIVCVLRHSL